MRLHTPTYITKLNDLYFIVDCWHHRILYTNNINNEIKDWLTIDYEFAGAHSIATDGDVYVIDNTGYNEVVVLDRSLKFKQKFKNIGIRPHRTVYDSVSKAFYVIASPNIFCFKKSADGNLYLYYQKELSFILGSYVRSISIIDGQMYFVSGQSRIVIANYLDESYSVIKSYPVPDYLTGMNDIFKFGDYYYITSTNTTDWEIKPAMLRTKNLNSLATGNYEDIYKLVGFTSTPYYMSVFDNKFYVTEIGDSSGVYSIDVKNILDINTSNVERVYIFDNVDSSSLERLDIYPT